MILKEGNKNKKVLKAYQGNWYYRYPVKTRVILAEDNFDEIIDQYLSAFLEKGDHVGIAESVLAITQKRVYKFSEIRYGFLAKFLSKFVKKSSAGIGLGTPQTMQLAIQEVGVLRILLAAFFSALGKLFGLRGIFYKIAGEKVRGIDGPTENTIPPYNEYASLIPKNPDQVIKRLEEKFRDKDIHFYIVDANDLGVNLIGKYPKASVHFMKEMFRDNPLGQSHESTPFLIVRRKR